MFQSYRLVKLKINSLQYGVFLKKTFFAHNFRDGLTQVLKQTHMRLPPHAGAQANRSAFGAFHLTMNMKFGLHLSQDQRKNKATSVCGISRWTLVIHLTRKRQHTASYFM